MQGPFYVIRHVMVIFYALAGKLGFKSLQVKSGFLLSELRYHYETLQGIFLLQTKVSMQYHSKILKIVKVTKKNVNRLVFIWTPFSLR